MRSDLGNLLKALGRLEEAKVHIQTLLIQNINISFNYKEGVLSLVQRTEIF